MALITEKSVFLHIPKCAGQFIRHVYKVCNIDHYEIGNHHTHFPELLRANPEEFYQNRFVFAFVRHPLTWYQSRWAFRMKHGWQMGHPLDFNSASNDFRVFVESALAYKPSGWVTCEYLNYIDAVPGVIDFVGRVENLVPDVIQAFRTAGELISENAIKGIPKINNSDLHDKPPKFWARYTKPLCERVLEVEKEIITRYYQDDIINPNNLCGPLPY